eukprot:6177890-Heterocapsa_arctica.AAC.2
MERLIRDHPFIIFTVGPDNLKSSTYTIRRSFSVGCQNTLVQSSMAWKPPASSLALQWASQYPPES